MMASTDTPKIGGVRIGAPLWEGATEEELLAIVECFSNASYHRAGEGSNYNNGRDHMRRAVSECNRLGLGYTAVRNLVSHKPQLVTTDEVIDAMLREYRSALLASEELASQAVVAIQNADALGDYDPPMMQISRSAIFDLAVALTAYRKATGAKI